MKPIPVFPQDSAAPVGPYSPAIRFGQMLFLSGQIPIGPDGNLVPGGVKEQTRQIFHNIKTILSDQNLDFANVIKTTVFMINLADFGVMNEVYAGFFGSHRPARSTIQVTALPKNAQVEIELMAGFDSPEPGFRG